MSYRLPRWRNTGYSFSHRRLSVSGSSNDAGERCDVMLHMCISLFNFSKSGATPVRGCGLLQGPQNLVHLFLLKMTRIGRFLSTTKTTCSHLQPGQVTHGLYAPEVCLHLHFFVQGSEGDKANRYRVSLNSLQALSTQPCTHCPTVRKQKRPKKLGNINYYSVPNQNKSKLVTNLSLHVPKVLVWTLNRNVCRR